MRIVDLRKKPECPYVYCGRFMAFSPVGRVMGSVLQNNFSKKKYGSEAIRLFRADLWTRMLDKRTGIEAAIRMIQEDWTLACWCVEMEGEEIITEPEQCHCQVIWKAWRWLMDRGPQPPSSVSDGSASIAM